MVSSVVGVSICLILCRCDTPFIIEKKELEQNEQRIKGLGNSTRNVARCCERLAYLTVSIKNKTRNVRIT
jgi:hypothetical protein